LDRYGLGQTYELLHQNFHSLFYFRQAARLRPRDARMFVAVGACCRWRCTARYSKGQRA
jgi:hypothetical protein